MVATILWRFPILFRYSEFESCSLVKSANVTFPLWSCFKIFLLSISIFEVTWAFHSNSIARKTIITLILKPNSIYLSVNQTDKRNKIKGKNWKERKIGKSFSHASHRIVLSIVKSQLNFPSTFRAFWRALDEKQGENWRIVRKHRLTCFTSGGLSGFYRNFCRTPASFLVLARF